MKICFILLRDRLKIGKRNWKPTEMMKRKLTSALQIILPLKGKGNGIVINIIKLYGNYFQKVLKKMAHNSKNFFKLHFELIKTKD